MSVCKALRLDQWGVKEAMTHPLLAGKKPFARGVFSAVYEGTRKNTVLKMTCDDIGYYLMNDPYYGVQHRHFPRVAANHGEIGNTVIGLMEHPIYLFEMERLEKIPTGSEAHRLARLITNVGGRTSASVGTHWRHERHTAQVLEAMTADKALPRSIRNAMDRLAEFARNIPGGTCDMHPANFMRRKNGELVISDPLANMKIFERAQKQLRHRGW